MADDMVHRCEDCGNKIDPEVCWCGQEMEDHAWENHCFVPIGCDCLRDRSASDLEKEEHADG